MQDEFAAGVLFAAQQSAFKLCEQHGAKPGQNQCNKKANTTNTAASIASPLPGRDDAPGVFAASSTRTIRAKLRLSACRQREFRPQAPDRRGAEREHAAIEIGKFDDDGQTEAEARLALVKPSPA